MKRIINFACLLMVIQSQAVFAQEFVVGQHNKAFVMNDNEINKINIKAGDTISFQNQDPFFHNIFSLSDLKTFDLGSFPRGESKAVVFDKKGAAVVECAIHPHMRLDVTVE